MRQKLQESSDQEQEVVKLQAPAGGQKQQEHLRELLHLLTSLTGLNIFKADVF